MKLCKQDSILFIRPDYHCTYIYMEQLEKIGWLVDIYVPKTYPEKLLFKPDRHIQEPAVSLSLFGFGLLLNKIIKIFWWFSIFWKYNYHFYYGRAPSIGFGETYLGLNKVFGASFSLELFILKLFRKKIIFFPSGCLDYSEKEIFELLDDGNVCGNCGYYDNCDSHSSAVNIARMRRFGDLTIIHDPAVHANIGFNNIKYKVIDLAEWSPELKVPDKFLLPDNGKVRIMHSSYLKGRDGGNKNIKGSPHVVAAIERLRKEGFQVEYLHVTNVRSRDMRYYQAQADIIIEQLIYGWWGSTFVEASALGKPVVCYLRPSWKTKFFQNFPEHERIPILEADTQTIYQVLKDLVQDEERRDKLGREAREFAEEHFCPEQNTSALTKLMREL